MCALSSVVSYAASPDEVAKKKAPIPTPTNARVRPSGQLSPRRRRADTPRRYRPAAQTVTTNRNGSRDHSLKTCPRVNLGRSRTCVTTGICTV
jgi:hypothetical protein